MHPVIQQMLWYALVMILTFVLIDLLLQGFFHKFVKVFGSLGRQCFVKIRHTTYDGIAIGREEEGFLLFKYKKKEYRIPISSHERYFYRFLFVQWIDVDGEKWALSKCDYTPVSGYDPVKIQSFIKRILMMPNEEDTFKKTVIIILVIIGILVIGVFIFDFMLMQKIDGVSKQVSDLASLIVEQSRTVTPAPI